METKLTLRLEKEIIERIKLFAMKEGLSLSDLTEDLYKTVLAQEQEGTFSSLSPIARKYKGILGSDSINEEDLRFQALLEKHAK